MTLSRDIRDLRLVKTREGYQEMAPEETGPGFALLAAEFLHDVLRAQNLVVLKTSPGHANSVAVALDSESWPEVVGTIAGRRHHPGDHARQPDRRSRAGEAAGHAGTRLSKQFRNRSLTVAARCDVQSRDRKGAVQALELVVSRPAPTA